MSLEADLRAFVLADGTVASMIGTRMHPVLLPQAPTLPALTYSTISAIRGHTMQGPDGLPETRIQIDSWAATYSAAAALAGAVRRRLDGHSGSIGTGSPQTVVQAIFADTERALHESEPELYRISADYRVWFEE